MPEFGVFKEFWNGQPHHLPFLNLYEPEGGSEEWNLQTSLNRLDELISSNKAEFLIEGVELLLKSEDWRPHLVAALASLKMKPVDRKLPIERLWERLGKGSWVSPQLLVILSIIDVEFKQKVDEILERGFKVTFSTMLPVEHHVTRGPAGSTVAEMKIIAAMHYLRNGTNVDSADSDGGGSIASCWKEHLMQLIAAGRFKLPDE